MNFTDMGKALLIPINSQREILIQDRRGFKEPDWGFFGGGIESGETPLGAVIRESKEELDIDILQEDIIYLGDIDMQWDNDNIQRYFFLYKTNQQDFTVLEGAGAHWMSFQDARNIMDKRERFDEIVEKINGLDF